MAVNEREGRVSTEGKPGGTVLLATGNPLAPLPEEPPSLDGVNCLRIYVGEWRISTSQHIKAEVNTAIGRRRLGLRSAWLRRLGNEPAGRRILATWLAGKVDTRRAMVDTAAPTGLNVREWLPGRKLRPHHFHHGDPGTGDSQHDWSAAWATDLGRPSPFHVLAISVAVSRAAARAVHSTIDRAGTIGCAISTDPNYPPALGDDDDPARNALLELDVRNDIQLISEEDAALLGGAEPERTRAPSTSPTPAGDPHTWCLRRGHPRHRRVARFAAAPIKGAVDQVDAAGGFNAGSLPARRQATARRKRSGAWCEARGRTGQLASGYPTRTRKLPTTIRYSSR